MKIKHFFWNFSVKCESKKFGNNLLITFNRNIISGTAELDDTKIVLIVSDKNLLIQVTNYPHSYYIFHRRE